MTITTVGNKMLCLCNSILKAFCLIHSKNGRKLFVSKFLRKLYALNLANKYLGALWNVYTCELSNLVCALSNYFGVKSTVDNNSLSNLISFFGRKYVASASFKFFSNLDRKSVV